MSRQVVPYCGLKPKDVKDAVWRAVVEAWENGLSDREAAYRASKYEMVTSKEIRSWIKENPEIGDLKAMLQTGLLSKAKENVADAIKDGDTNTSKWYLERKAADEFSTKSAVAFEGAAIEVTIEEKEKALQEMVENFNSGE